MCIHALTEKTDVLSENYGVVGGMRDVHESLPRLGPLVWTLVQRQRRVFEGLAMRRHAGLRLSEPNDRLI